MSRRRSPYIQLVAVAIAALSYFGMKVLQQSGNIPHGAGSGWYVVERVVDGDTVKLSDGERVRLIGIDTPELHYSNKLLADSRRSHKDIETIQGFGMDAKKYVQSLVFGKRVRLEYDVEKRDAYGRILAYVYLGDGTFVNGKIVRDGYAQTMTIPPNVKYADHFLKMQREAREAKRGLWAAADYDDMLKTADR